MAMILEPAELARTLSRDLGPDGALRYARMIGMGGTELGWAYAEAAKILEHARPCPTCGVYTPGGERGVCEVCEVYAERDRER